MNNTHKFDSHKFAIILTIALLASFIPNFAMADSSSDPYMMPINPYPDKIYGEEFRSASSPYGIGWSVGYQDLTDNSRNSDWTMEFFLNQVQMDQLTQWEQNDCNMSLFEVFSLLVPEQMAALPSPLQEYLKNHPEIVINHAIPPRWRNPGNGDIWIDPSGTTVPEQYVPWVIKDGINYKGVPLYVDDTRFEYTNEVKTHLANLGLVTDYNSVDLSVITSIPNEKYTITLEGNTPYGVRKSWTFVLDVKGVWHNTETGQVMDIDSQYVLAALTYLNPPGQSYSPVTTVTKSVNQLATPASTQISTVNLSSLVAKSSQYTQTIHNPGINSNALLPKIVVSSTSPSVRNSSILLLKANSMNNYATNIPPTNRLASLQEKTARLYY